MLNQKSSTATSCRKWTRLSNGLFIATCALILTGCAAQTPLLPARAAIPPNLTSPCPDLSPLTDGSGASVLRKLVEVAEMYYDCKRKHGGLAEAVDVKGPAP